MFYKGDFSKFIVQATLVLVFAGMSAYATVAQRKQYTGDPVTKYGLVTSLKSKQYQNRQIVEVITSQGVDFRLTPEIRNELISSGARSELVNVVEKNYRSGKTGKARQNTSKYQNLIDEAINQYNVKNDVNGSIKILESAVKVNSKNSKAYQLLGFAYLDGLKDHKKSEQYMTKAINLGGSAVFRVRHSHDLTFSYSCEGSLYVSKNDVRYEGDNVEHTFDVQKNYISNVATVGGWGKFIRRKGGAFKITIRDQKDKDDKDKYNFSPLDGKKDSAKLIIKLIGK